jgi:hypothetical protein
MAYAYDRTMQALGLTGQDQQGQQDQGGSVQLSQESVGQSSGAGQSAGSPAQQQAQQPQASTGARGRVMARNVAKAKAPTDLGKVQSGIGQARQNLQNEANAYVQRADDPYEMSAEQVQGNIQAYAKGQQKPSDMSWLTNYQSAPGMVEDFKPETSTDIKDVDLLKNDAGIRELFRRGQDPEGTIGEAALDASLIRRNQPFQMQRDEALRSYQQLKNEEADLTRGDLRQQAQEKRNKAATSYKDLVAKELGTARTRLDELAAQREKTFDEQLAAAEQARQGQYMQDLQSYLDEMASSGRYDPYTSEQLRKALGAGSLYDPGALDPTQFYQSGKTAADTDVNQFYTGDEASQWNVLSSLLGQPGQVRAPGSLADSDVQSFLGGGVDKDAFAQAALQYAAPRAIGTQESEAQMQADQQFKAANLFQEQQRQAEAKRVAEAAAEKQRKLDAANIAQVNRNLQKKGGKK